MPDYTNCERDELGDTYCYDYATGEVMQIRFERIPIKKVPQEILAKFLQKECKRNSQKGTE